MFLFAMVVPPSAGCATSGPFVADRTERVPAASAREGTTADDVFMRAPWERWRVPNGTGRYHRGMHLLLRDESGPFRVADIAVYAADGSDVRLDYASIDLGTGSQSRVSISVFVYRAPSPLDAEWRDVSQGMQRKWPRATPAQALPAPDRHPDEMLTMALLAPGNGQTGGTFVQTYLFHDGAWAARYEIACAAEDLPVARPKMLAFLGSLPVR
jgi:hypothetical protein